MVWPDITLPWLDDYLKILSHCNNENGGADLTGIPAASMVNRGVAKLFRSRVDFPPSTDPWSRSIYRPSLALLSFPDLL